MLDSSFNSPSVTVAEMTLLSVDKLYALSGQRQGNKGGSTSTRPRVLQVRLPAEILNQLIEHGGRMSIENVLGAEPTLAIDDVHHAFQRAVASTSDSPHHLHSFDNSSSSGQPHHLDFVGEIQYKLSAKSHAMPSSSITSKLKERRELEEARKSEHRTVLLDTAPSSKKSPASTKLKLKPKALASASNSPLMHSRAATPIESGSPTPAGKSGNGLVHSQSQPEQIQLKSSPLKRDASPNGLRRQLLQLLALGPLSRRQIVQKIPFAEPQIASMLPRLATTPDHLQPPPANGAIQRKFTGPVNRRSQQTGMSVAQQTQSRSPPNGEKGPSTVYALTDEAYQEVLVKDWPDYDGDARTKVSALMESALDRLCVAKTAIERSQIVNAAVPKQHEKVIATRKSERVRDEEVSDGADAKHDQSPVKSDSGGSKKPTTKQRLAKAAKGRLSSASAASSAKVASSKPTEKALAKEAAATPNHVSKPTLSSSSAAAPAAGKQRSTQMEKKAVTQATRRASVNLSRTSSSGGTAKPRKDIEYTDSSEEEEKEKKSRPEKTAPDEGKNGGDAGPKETRGRQPVGRGAIMSDEPWLEVRNEREWHELAKRFKRLYDEYQTGLARVREEEEMLRHELAMARAEAADENVRSRSTTRRQTRNSIGSGGQSGSGSGGGGGDAEMLDANDEREEGEASPTIEQGATLGAANALESGPFAWRSAPDNAGKTDRGAPTGKPMKIEEMDALVASVLGLEGQLKRMKSSLHSSKERLEA